MINQKKFLICYLCWVTADLSHTQLWWITYINYVVNMFATLPGLPTAFWEHINNIIIYPYQNIPTYPYSNFYSSPRWPSPSTCLQLEVLDSCKAFVSYQMRAIHKQFLLSILKTLYFCFWLYCMVLLHWHNDRCQWCHIQSYHNGQCQYLFLQGLD